MTAGATIHHSSFRLMIMFSNSNSLRCHGTLCTEVRLARAWRCVCCAWVDVGWRPGRKRRRNSIELQTAARQTRRRAKGGSRSRIQGICGRVDARASFGMKAFGTKAKGTGGAREVGYAAAVGEPAKVGQVGCVLWHGRILIRAAMDELGALRRRSTVFERSLEASCRVSSQFPIPVGELKTRLGIDETSPMVHSKLKNVAPNAMALSLGPLPLNSLSLRILLLRSVEQNVIWRDLLLLLSIASSIVSSSSVGFFLFRVKKLETVCNERVKPLSSLSGHARISRLPLSDQ